MKLFLRGSALRSTGGRAKPSPRVSIVLVLRVNIDAKTTIVWHDVILTTREREQSCHNRTCICHVQQLGFQSCQTFTVQSESILVCFLPSPRLWRSTFSMISSASVANLTSTPVLQAERFHVYKQSVQLSRAFARAGNRVYGNGSTLLRSCLQPRPSRPRSDASLHFETGPCLPVANYHTAHISVNVSTIQCLASNIVVSYRAQVWRTGGFRGLPVRSQLARRG